MDPLIRNELMGHAAAGGKGGGGLGMTAVYTHTRPETKRRQLEAAMAARSGIAEALARRMSAEGTTAIGSRRGDRLGMEVFP